jgi:hypothetical protein
MPKNIAPFFRFLAPVLVVLGVRATVAILDTKVITVFVLMTLEFLVVRSQ